MQEQSDTLNGTHNSDDSIYHFWYRCIVLYHWKKYWIFRYIHIVFVLHDIFDVLW